MNKIFNELGFSFVLGKGNWIGFSYEIEKNNNEFRSFGWKKISLSKIKDIYIRIWILKKVLVISIKSGINMKNKTKFGLKLILGFSNV